MKKAYVENGSIKDVAHSDPYEIFTPEVADLYTENVEDNIRPGAIKINGQWKNIEPVFIFKWEISSVRNCLTVRERVKWDNDSSETIKTAKIEIGFGIKREPLLELLELLVEVGDLSQATADKIIALEPVEIE